MPYGRRRYAARRTVRRTRSTARRTTRRYSRKGNAVAYRALRIARSANRRVAGEVCKFESVPSMYNNTVITAGSAGTSYSRSANSTPPLNTIVSGEPWIMPLNWVYSPWSVTGGSQTGNVRINNITYTAAQVASLANAQGGTFTVSVKQPIWYNTFGATTDASASSGPEPGQTTELQYRLKYIYINALFNAAAGNPDGALRIVIVKDRQPTGGALTWYDITNNENSRGVFNAQRIDAQLNPNTVGRYKIMYDKTLRFTTINSYKPFKYYKALSTIVRNNRDIVSANTEGANAYIQTNDSAPPVQRNAYYLMIYSDGLNFTFTSDPVTADGTFHLFNRVAFYNN